MEEAITNKLREQQHTDRGLGNKTRPETTAPQPQLEQAKGTVRHLLSPRTPSPEPLHEQLLGLRELAREDRQHSQNRSVTEQSGKSSRLLQTLFLRKSRSKL